MHYPNMKPEEGDKIMATPEHTWGNLTEHHRMIEPEEPIIVKVGNRYEPPNADEWRGKINGKHTTIHMDTFTNIFHLANNLMYTR